MSTGRNPDSTFESHLAVVGNAIRQIRNAAAHDSVDVVGEFEATLAIASVVVATSALTQKASGKEREEAEVAGSLHIGNSPPEKLREHWRQIAPNALCRWLARSSPEQVRALTRGQGIDFYRHILSGATMSQLNRLPQSLNSSGADLNPFADALMLELPAVLDAVGRRVASLLWRFVTYLTPPQLRPLRLILFAMMPYDETWLTSRLAEGRSLTATSFRLKKVRSTNPALWKTIGGNPSSAKQNAAFAWAVWDGSVETVHQPFVLAHNSPPLLRRAILDAATQEAAVWLFSRKVGHSFLGSLFSHYVSASGRRTPEFTEAITAALMQNAVEADATAQRQVVSGLSATGTWTAEKVAIVDAVFAQLHDVSRQTVSILIAGSLNRPGIAAASANRLILARDDQADDWWTLVLRGIVAVQKAAEPTGEWLVGSWLSPSGVLIVPEEAHRIEIGLAMYALHVTGHEAECSRLQDALHSRPLNPAASPFARWTATLLAGSGIEALSIPAASASRRNLPRLRISK